MKAIKDLFETIKEAVTNWGDEQIDEWDENYLSMTLNS